MLIQSALVMASLLRDRLAAVVGAEDAAAPAADLVDAGLPALLALYDGVHGPGLLARDRQADAAGGPGQALLELAPGGAAVGALEDAAEVLAVRVGRACHERPRRSLARVERRVEGARIGGI